LTAGQVAGGKNSSRRVNMRFSTKREVIDQAVTPALGDFAADYDIDAIADETFAYEVDEDGDGNELLNTAGFVQAVSEERFWEIVEAHHLEVADA
jgi:hypothetical protein